MHSRTTMLEELGALLRTVPADAPREAYRAAVLDENVLGKPTASSRKKALKYLRALYALDPGVCLFREFRRLYGRAGEDRPLLIGLLAMAREPVLRACLGRVIDAPIGHDLGEADFEAWMRGRAPGRYSEATYGGYGLRLYASFHQIGYLGPLRGRLGGRPRTHPVTGTASAAYAAFLDWTEGRSGVALLAGTYSRALDLPKAAHLDLLRAAGIQGLLRFAYAGGVLELAFPGFLRGSERRLTP
ncbi:MAG: hypothetical protein MUF66_05640 [Gammaproteobacteria bacterium]|nr:hypothetical protein [Gammaproteobacteria bacterium]